MQQGVIIIQLLVPELRMLVREEMRRVLSETGIIKAVGLQEDLLTIDSAAELLGTAKSTLYSLASKRQIPYFKRGRRLYFRRSELLQWVNEGRKS